MTTKEPDEKPRKRPSRLETELAEILERTDRPPSNVIKFRAKARQSRGRWRDFRLSAQRSVGKIQRVGAGTLLILSLVLAFVGSRINGSSHVAAYLLGILAVALFVAVFVVGYREPKGGQSKQWRGRDIRFEPWRPSWLNRKPKPPKR